MAAALFYGLFAAAFFIIAGVAEWLYNLYIW